MGYNLEELLKKIGSPEVIKKHESRWHYTDEKDSEYGGFADIKLNKENTILTVDLYHRKRKEESDLGTVYGDSIESFAMQAEKSSKDGLFYIKSLAFDGEVYDPKDNAMFELGCSVFYSRAVEISTAMIRQEFNKAKSQEIKTKFQGSNTMERLMAQQSADDTWGVVVPFPSRRAVG